MTYTEAHQLLDRRGQAHLLGFWPKLNADQQAGLLAQIAALDWDAVDALLARLHAQPSSTDSPGAAARNDSAAGAGLPPAPVVTLLPHQRGEPRRVGEEALRAGEVGVILVAGGQGTRLGFDAPKGTFPLAPISGASLFEIHARKILALERRHGGRIPFYIMTSEGNDADTRRFFEARKYFGLAPDRVRFFVQGVYPAFGLDGRAVLESPARISTAPDGHGGVLAALQRSGLLADMEQRRLATLFYFQVDNPLVEIADPVFVGLHRQRGADMSLKVCARRDPHEGLGVVVARDGRCAVVEYTELTEAQKHATAAGGELLYKFGSVAIHAFALRFLQREAGAGLPLHQAHKKVPYCDAEGRTIKPDQPNACKFEKFIFDALPDAARPLILEFAREEEFAPVKNAEGQDTPDSARTAMMEKAARWLEACGVQVPRAADARLKYRLEIDPAYANSYEELRGRLPGDFQLRRETLLSDQRPG